MPKKRKLSAYNLHVRKAVKSGKSFRQAARSWKAKSPGKRKTYKVKKRNSYGAKTMVKRRRKTARRRTSLGSSLRLGSIPGMLKSVGLAFAVGAGTVTALNYISDTARIPQLRQYAGIAGAYAAFTTSAGLPGIAAAIPLIQQSGLMGGAAPQAQGQGAFV